MEDGGGRGWMVNLCVGMREEPAGGGDHGGRGIRVVTVRV